MSRAYNRWLCERILAQEPRIISMLYLPFNDPDEPTRRSRSSATRRAWSASWSPSPRYTAGARKRLHEDLRAARGDGQAALLPRRLQLGDARCSMTNRFISVHALGFMWYNMLHMTNWVINGLPERFPKLKVMWIESGLDLGRLPDAAARQRIHDAHIRSAAAQGASPANTCARCIYATQPMEVPDDQSVLEATFKMINAETQLRLVVGLSALGLRPAGDDLRPAVPRREAKRNILGGNAARLFNPRYKAGEEDSVVRDFALSHRVMAGLTGTPSQS